MNGLVTLEYEVIKGNRVVDLFSITQVSEELAVDDAEQWVVDMGYKNCSLNLVNAHYDNQ